MMMIRLSFLKSSLMTMMMMFQVQTEVPQAAEKAASKATVMIVTKMRIPMMMKELMNQKARRAFMNLTVITVIVLTNQRVTVIVTVVSAEQANNLLTVKSREPNTRQDIRIRDWTYLFDSGALPQHSPTLTRLFHSNLLLYRLGLPYLMIACFSKRFREFERIKIIKIP